MPALPISKSQLGKLGDRLRDRAEPDPVDRALLEEVLIAYGEALQVVTADLRELGFVPASRVKTTETIIDKLRRGRGSSLKSIHDLAGARVVLHGDLAAQEAAVGLFSAGRDPEPTWIDRRADPRSGYRAVHVVVRVDGIPVEVQFRTDLQDIWAETFERLGDVWGRQIRYGGSPAPDPRGEDATTERTELVALMLNLSTIMSEYEKLCAAGEIKQAATEVENLMARADWVRSNYEAYQSAKEGTGKLIHERLNEVARRAGVVAQG